MRLDQPDGHLMEGRGVIVTGAGSGIGRALARGFARDGAEVVGVDKDAEGISALRADNVLPLVGDVTFPEVIEDAIAMVLRETRHVDVLINNAGFGLHRKIEDLAVGEFESVYSVHVLASLYSTRAVVPRMRQRGYGRIVNVISRAAEACRPSDCAYASAKAALWALSRVTAAELGANGILVNCLIPGMTNTGIWGRPRPELQEPDTVYPTALALATLPANGPNGRVFWDLNEYSLFKSTIDTGIESSRTSAIQ